MTKQYRYDTKSVVPRLMHEVEVFHPTSSERVSSPARIDTGADITLIPEPIKEQLKLLPAGEKSIGGIRGEPVRQQTYYVRIVFEKLTKYITVATTDRRYVLVGLDILNNFKLHADGKHQSFTLKDP